MRDLIEDLRELTERRARKRKGPQATLGSLQRWLRGATPAMKAYAKTMSKVAHSHRFTNPRAADAATETANILQDLEGKIQRLKDTVDTTLSEF